MTSPSLLTRAQGLTARLAPEERAAAISHSVRTGIEGLAARLRSPEEEGPYLNRPMSLDDASTFERSEQPLGVTSLSEDALLPPSVAIIGTGINAVIIALYAARAGYDVTVRGRGDIADEASGNCTGILHKGIRYLQLLIFNLLKKGYGLSYSRAQYKLMKRGAK